MNLRDPQVHDVHRLDLLTGELTLVAQNPGDVANRVFSASGAVFAAALDGNGDFRLSRFDPERGLVSLANFPGPEPVGLPLVLLVHGGPRFATAGVTTPACSCWPIAATPCCRSTCEAPPASARASRAPRSGSTRADERRPGRRRPVGGGAGHRRPGSCGDLRRFLRRLQRPGGSHLHPEVFAAAIDYCGISNLPNFMRNVPVYWRNILANSWFLYVGDPADPEDEADMLARSPISRLGAIWRPLLVIHGAKDVRVVQAESDRIVDVLRARGADGEYLLKDNQGHGFANAENNIEAFRTIERFLGRTLGGEVVRERRP